MIELNENNIVFTDKSMNIINFTVPDTVPNYRHCFYNNFPQNNSWSVSFTPASLTVLFFENPKHDFPAKITYAKTGQDSIYTPKFRAWTIAK